MVNRRLKSLVFSATNTVPPRVVLPSAIGAESRINQPNHCSPVPSEVVLAQPIHGLLRKRAAVLAAEN
jgi:hypothetical protein